MIICSAILFKNKKTGDTQIIAGRRHSDCFSTIYKLVGENYKQTWETIQQGFITHNNKFMNRKDAYKYAVEIGQISSEADIEWSKKYDSMLYSEMLY